MGLRIKPEVNVEELSKYGFKTGKEWAEAGERCLDDIGYKYQHNWYHKFLMDLDEPERIAYISDEYDIPRIQIRIIEENRNLDIAVAAEETWVSGEDLDIVTDTIFELTNAGILENVIKE